MDLTANVGVCRRLCLLFGILSFSSLDRPGEILLLLDKLRRQIMSSSPVEARGACSMKRFQVGPHSRRVHISPRQAATQIQYLVIYRIVRALSMIVVETGLLSCANALSTNAKFKR